MPAITASMVGALRAKTDAPMMECKKALTEADGDMERAEEILRVKLGSKAGKASSRVTAEGVVAASVAGQGAALVEVNCETDFVSKNDDFLPSARPWPIWWPAAIRPTWPLWPRCRWRKPASVPPSKTCARA
jgi:elongation factor Ts